MQPDGTLNPSAEPKELPGPLRQRRVLLAGPHGLGARRGLRRLQEGRPRVRAASSRERMDLAVSAIDRQVLDQGRRRTSRSTAAVRPAWLIAEGADASAEAVLGLAAYVRAGGSGRRPARAGAAQRRHRPAVRRRRPRLAVRRRAALGAVPVRLARLVLADAGRAGRAPSDVLGDRSLARTAARDSFTFDPWMLTSGGPDNGRLPTRADATQIAYGADSRVQSLIATGGDAGEPARRRRGRVVLRRQRLAGHRPTTRPPASPSTASPADGTVNHNSGAESTIHGLLTDARARRAPGGPRRSPGPRRSRDRLAPSVARGRGRHAGRRRHGRRSRRRCGPASRCSAAPATPSLRDGGTATFDAPRAPALAADAGRRPAAAAAPAVTTFRAGRHRARRRSGPGDIGAQGDSPAPGALLPVTLPATLPAGAPHGDRDHRPAARPASTR